MPHELIVLAFLWTAAGLAVLADTAPAVMGLLGLSRYRCERAEDPTLARPYNELDSHESHVYQQLSRLAMRPLGVAWEKAYFFAVHWYKSFALKTFTSPDHSLFACVYRLVPFEPVRVALVTCFQDGSMVWTGNHMEKEKTMADNYIRWGINTTNLSELLRCHHQVVDRLTSKGRQRCRHDRLEVLVRSLLEHSPKHLHDPTLNLLSLVLSLLLPVGALCIGLSNFGTSHWITPAGVLLGCLIWKAGFYLLRSAAAGECESERGT